jgi:membrane protein YdbS with pleckstrin-like domain
MAILPAFIDHPKKIRFAEQEENENIEIFLRPHWVTNVGWAITALIGSLLPIIYLFYSFIFQANLFGALHTKTVVGFFILWYMIVMAFIIEKYLHWYFNVYIVTDQNVVDINFYSLLARTIVEIRLKDIQSQSSSMNGISESFFRYGDVHVVSASDRQMIDFISVPYPDKVADRIQDLRYKLGH